MSEEELTYKDIDFFLQDKFLKQLKIVALSGGEPFLKDDLIQIIEEFQRIVRPSTFHITTNGYLSEKIVDSVRFLKKRGFNLEIKVSIDDIADKHDLLRSKEGSFKRAIATLDGLRSIFSKKELLIGVNQTIFEDNCRSIRQVKKIADDFDACYVGFVGLEERPLYSAEAKSSYDLVKFSNENRNYLIKELKKMYSWKSYFTTGLKIYEEAILKHYIKGQIRLLEGRSLAPFKCMSLFTYFRLNPNGDIVTCSYDLESLGNIKKESYSEILAKKQARDKLAKVKNCGKCWLGCEVSPSWVSSFFLS
jgi:MoaA/NifB/PqqE/SkfB family radical SAM enzyme